MTQRRFELAFLSEKKIHTLRENYPFWKKRIDAINRGEGYLSIRIWVGKPYRSKQREVSRLNYVGIEKLKREQGKDGPVYYIVGPDGLYFVSMPMLANHDGLLPSEFYEWFQDYPYGEMAVIHFTGFRYLK
jgi:hypothetical protein